MFAVLISQASETRSQTLSDTICFKIGEVQNLLIAAKQKKYADSLVTVYRSDISILNQKVAAFEIKDSTNKQINSTYQAMVQTMKDQRGILEGQINYLNKELRMQRTKTKLTAFGGIALSAIVAGLFIF